MNIDNLVLLCLITKHTICLQRTHSTKRSVIYGKQIWCNMRGHEKKTYIYICIYISGYTHYVLSIQTNIYIMLYTIKTCVFGILWTWHIPTIVGILPQWDGHIVKLWCQYSNVCRRPTCPCLFHLGHQQNENIYCIHYRKNLLHYLHLFQHFFWPLGPLRHFQDLPIHPELNLAA